MFDEKDFEVVRGQFENLESDKSLSQATFASGCFWCLEASIQEMDGVEEVLTGYAGGEEENPTYYEVTGKRTGHRESVRVYYDPNEVSYEDLLEKFWQGIDPTDDGGQFVDRGFSYTTAIFFHDEKQEKLAEESKRKLAEELGEEVVTEVLPVSTFYPAEDFHQDFYKHSAFRYKLYKKGSGRE